MNWPLLGNSLFVSGLTALLASVLGFGAATWLVGREARWREVFLGLAVVALALPPFVVTNCWLDIAGNGGWWQQWVPFNLASPVGAAWILSLLTWPIPLFLVWSAWQRLEPAQLESDPAVTGWRLICGLLWPAARTAAVQGAVLTFVLALNNFAGPAILPVH